MKPQKKNQVPPPSIDWRSARSEELLGRASREIQGLRQRNVVLEAKVDTFDKCFKMVSAGQQNRDHNGASCEDICWQIERHLVPQEPEGILKGCPDVKKKR